MESKMLKTKDEYYEREFKFFDSLKDIHTRINLIRNEGVEVAEIARDTMDIVRTLIRWAENKPNRGLDPELN